MPQNKDHSPEKSSPDFKSNSTEYPPSIYDEAFWVYGVDMSEGGK